MTTISCPVCRGPVTLDRDPPSCLVGHTFEPDSLQEATQRAADRALWMAVRALEDATTAARWVLGQPHMSDRKPYLSDAVKTGDQASELLRDLIGRREGGAADAENRPDGW